MQHGLAKRTLLITIIALFSTLAFSANKPANLNLEVRAYIKNIAKKYNLNRNKLTATFKQARYTPAVIASISKPFETKPWNFYRSYFLKPKRIEHGAQYWKNHAKTIQTITDKYGVDPSVIIAIIGVESFYGRHAGTYPELDALYTLAFYYPPREKFFRKELTQFILLSRKDHISLLETKGSYAGALGIPQFMPSSYRYYGVSYSKKPKIDLLNKHDDAIASIANYLKRAGWQSNQPIAIPVKINGKMPTKLISAKGKPNTTVGKLRKAGVIINSAIANNQKVALIMMQNTHSEEYWVVFKNFYAITRYNPSNTYALAVYQLSRAIRKDHDQ